MRVQRYFIIGASGFIGTRLSAALGAQVSLATFSSRPLPGAVYFDPLSMRLSDVVDIERQPPTHAFVLYGMTNIDQCATEPERAYEINVVSQMRVIDELVAHGVVPVLASSDAVFNGTRGMWTEDDEPDPILTYGRHKAAVERHLARIGAPSIVARLAKVVDPTPGSGELLDSWLTQLAGSAPIRCAADQVFSPVAASDVVAALSGLAARGLTGTYHVCGPRPLTRLAFLQTLAAAMAAHREVRARIEACSIRDFSFAEPRPVDASMSPRRICAALGFEFEDMAAVCARAARLRFAATLVQ